ncbi:ethyl tert-butyl ether degradation EthD [Fonsecaea pedrosoi]|nr:ethyl tert-butyl ether degradation EthD [Fonsecaea pedrosoi]
MSLQKVCRISVLVTKRADITDKEFHSYWANGHGPLVAPMLIKYGILKYTQYHMTPEYKAKGAAIGMPSPYDGIAEFLVNKYEDMSDFFSDPEYMVKIRPDEAKFVDIDKIVFNVGVDYVQINDNKFVEHEGPSSF